MAKAVAGLGTLWAEKLTLLRTVPAINVLYLLMLASPVAAVGLAWMLYPRLCKAKKIGEKFVRKKQDSVRRRQQQHVPAHSACASVTDAATHKGEASEYERARNRIAARWVNHCLEKLFDPLNDGLRAQVLERWIEAINRNIQIIAVC